MFFGYKSIDDLTYDDIVLFISQRISESINLDYKMELTNTKELAKDVSSFANTEGGILIYGVETDESDEPKPIEDNAIVGIQTEPGLKEKIENQIINCILPKPDFFIKVISIPQEPQEKKSVIIIEVFKSFNCVHMVICRRDYRYYKRYNFSSIPLDEKEIQNKYKEIGITEKLIEKRIEKCITNINDLIPEIREKGLLALSFSPLNLHKRFFTDFSKINDVIRQQNHPEFISEGRTLIMQQNRFHKALDFGEDILYGFFDIYCDGMLVLGQLGNLYAQNHINATALYYNIYHTLDLAVKLYSDSKLWSYIKINFTLKHIIDKNLKFNDVEKLDMRHHSLILKEEYETFEEIKDLTWIKHNIANLSRLMILPLFHICNFHEIQGCADDNGMPIYR